MYDPRAWVITSSVLVLSVMVKLTTFEGASNVLNVHAVTIPNDGAAPRSAYMLNPSVIHLTGIQDIITQNRSECSVDVVLTSVPFASTTYERGLDEGRVNSIILSPVQLG
jgi:hypothetical protein